MAIISTATLGLVFSTAGIASAKSALPTAAQLSGAHTTIPTWVDSDGATIVDGDMRFLPKKSGDFVAANGTSAPTSVGSPTVLVVLLTENGHTQRWPTPTIQAAYDAAAAFYATSSDGAFTPHFVLTSQLVSTGCSLANFGSNLTTYNNALPGLGYAPGNYDDISFYTSGCDRTGYPGVLGIGNIGARGNFIYSDDTSFVSAAATEKAIVHEYGHNLGLVHAGSLNCSNGGQNTALTGSCVYDRTGDELDPMGYFPDLADFSAFDQFWLGWAGGGRIKVGKTGQYTLNTVGARSGLQFLAIPRADGSTMYVEYRSMTGSDSSFASPGAYHPAMTPGLMLRWSRFGASGTAFDPSVEGTSMIHVRPVTPYPLNGFSDDSTITSGSFTTPEGDVSISVLSHTALTMTFNVTSNADGMVTVNPDRVLDTRLGNGAPKAKVPAGGTVQIDVTQRGTSMVPDNAKAVALNVTATQTSGTAFMTVWPCDQQRPDASNINTYANMDTPNAVISKIGANGLVCIFAEQATDLIADVNGYFPATSSYHPLNPTRILDTRLTNNTQSHWYDYSTFAVTGGRPNAGRILAVPISTTVTNSPLVNVFDRFAGSAVLNVTAVSPTVGGFVTVWPCFSAQPNASSLNVNAGQVRANMVVTGLGAFSLICVYVEQSMDVIVDVEGWMPLADPYDAVVPDRVLDTRLGIGIPTAPLGQNYSGAVQVTGHAPSSVPADAQSVILNITSANATSSGFITMWPCGSPMPDSSSLNIAAGTNVANAVVAKIGAGGTVCFSTTGATDFIVDVVGYQPA